MNRMSLILQYLRTWFLLDVASALPYELMIPTHKGLVGLPRLLRVLRIVKLFRCAAAACLPACLRCWWDSIERLPPFRESRLVRVYSQIHHRKFRETGLGRRLGSTLLRRVAVLIFVFLTWMHWSACIQVMVPAYMEFPDDSWPAQISIQYLPASQQWAFAAFKAVSAIVCCGYGSATANNLPDAIASITCIAIGASIFANVQGLFTYALLQHSTQRVQYDMLRDTLETYLRVSARPMCLLPLLGPHAVHPHPQA